MVWRVGCSRATLNVDWGAPCFPDSFLNAPRQLCFSGWVEGEETVQASSRCQAPVPPGACSCGPPCPAPLLPASTPAASHVKTAGQPLPSEQHRRPSQAALFRGRMAPPPYPPAGEEEVRVRGAGALRSAAMRGCGAMLGAVRSGPGRASPNTLWLAPPSGWQHGLAGPSCPVPFLASLRCRGFAAPPRAPVQAPSFSLCRSGGRRPLQLSLPAPPSPLSSASHLCPQPWLMLCAAHLLVAAAGL